jgi:hypothetical protein
MPLRRAAALAFGFAVTLLSCSIFPAQAQNSGPCDDAYLKSLPQPTVKNDRVVQIVNCTDQPLLGATNAGHRAFPYSATAGAVTLNPNQEYLMLGSLLPQINSHRNMLNRDCVTPEGMPDDHYYPTDDGTDFLPGYGNYSANSDAGHLHLKGYSTNVLQRAGFPVGPYAWAGVALYLQVNPANADKLAQKHAQSRHLMR